MHVESSEDVIPLSDLKNNPRKVVGRAQDTHRPILITGRGCDVAVIQALEDYERAAEIAVCKGGSAGTCRCSREEHRFIGGRQEVVGHQIHLAIDS